MYFLHNCIAISQTPITAQDVDTARELDAFARFFFMPAESEEVPEFYIILLFVETHADGTPNLMNVAAALPGYRCSRWSSRATINPNAVELEVDTDNEVDVPVANVDTQDFTVVDSRVQQQHFPALPAPKPETNVQPARHLVGMFPIPKQQQPWWGEMVVEKPAKLDVVKELLSAAHTPAS